MKETKTVGSKKFVPGVIEPSFGIGRIIYCMLEHCFYTREGTVRDERGAYLAPGILSNMIMHCASVI